MTLYYFIDSFEMQSNMSKTMQKRVELDILQGRIVGNEDVLPNSKPYFSFKGIPYAQPPVGELRFAATINIILSS